MDFNHFHFSARLEFFAQCTPMVDGDKDDRGQLGVY